MSEAGAVRDMVVTNPPDRVWRTGAWVMVDVIIVSATSKLHNYVNTNDMLLVKRARGSLSTGYVKSRTGDQNKQKLA
jgi:hypothetical protein